MVQITSTEIDGKYRVKKIYDTGGGTIYPSMGLAEATTLTVQIASELLYHKVSFSVTFPK